MRLDVKRQLFARSERVKGIDFHDTEPWILTTLYNGHAHIWSYETQAVIKSYELTDVPIRAGRFICRKNWICVGSDDFQLRVTNYNTGEKVKSFEAHPDYIRAIAVHPTLPYVLTASDDMTIRMWDWDNGWTMRRDYGLERAWCVSYQKGKQGIAMGFDDGAVVVKMGREEPAVSMDSTGKLIWSRVNEVLSGVVRGDDASLKDGAPIALPAKELGNIEVYAGSVSHSPSGRFVAICGDGEYLIYTALAFRQQGFGKALDFVWSASSNNDYAIRESSTSVKVFKKLKEKGPIDVGFSAEGLSGGALLGIKGQGGIGMFDWDTGALVRRIEVDPREVVWSESGELVALCCADTTYILRFNREAYIEGVNAGLGDEDGIEAAFELLHEVSDAAITAHWIGDSLVYTTEGRQLKQLIGEQTDTIAHFDQSMYVLRYLPRDGRLYLCDKDVNVVSYSLSTTVVEYQTLVLRGDIEGAQSLLADVPASQMNKIARFLESQGHKDLGLQVATDPEHRFELALGLNNLAVALEIAKEQDTEHKYKLVGDAALSAWDLETAEDMFVRARDIGSLLLLYTSSGNKDKLKKLAVQAEDAGSHNIAFASLWSSGDVDAAIDLVLRAGRTSEAVLFSHTYKPSRTAKLVKTWKAELEKQAKAKVSRLLGLPGEDEELFPHWDEYIKLEEQGSHSRKASGLQESLVEVDGAEGAATNGLSAATNGTSTHDGDEQERAAEEA
ncbi:hypothetical protein DV736_g5039, partial [Chaetothyriales sp. CBS 134916]